MTRFYLARGPLVARARKGGYFMLYKELSSKEERIMSFEQAREKWPLHSYIIKKIEIYSFDAMNMLSARHNALNYPKRGNFFLTVPLKKEEEIVCGHIEIGIVVGYVNIYGNNPMPLLDINQDIPIPAAYFVSSLEDAALYEDLSNLNEILAANDLDEYEYIK